MPPTSINALGSRQQKAQVSTEDEQIASQLRSLRVLMAEDNLVNAKVAETILKNFIDNVTVVENGQLALNALQTGDYDLVLMDKQMPVLDGLAATRQIRSCPPPMNKIPIIAVTADVYLGSKEEILASGMDEYVPKPIDGNSLLAAIIRVLASAQRGRTAN